MKVVAENEQGVLITEEDWEKTLAELGYFKRRTCTNIADRYNDFECSECGARWGGFLRGVFHYCPNCGAKVVD